jgi:hypothetical protein
MCRDIVCIFSSIKQDKNKSQREKKRKKGSEGARRIFSWVRGSLSEERNNPQEEGKYKKKKYRKKTFINFAPITGTLGRKRMKEYTERRSEESTSE